MNKELLLKYKKLSENAKDPVRGTPGSSGLDVFSPIDCVIPARGDYLIPTDLAFDIPFGWDLAVYNKSGRATKDKLFKGAELIDSDYTGNCHIHFFKDMIIAAGNKYACLLNSQIFNHFEVFF